MSKGIIAGVVGILSLANDFAETMPMAKNAPKVLIEANRSRRTKIEGGDWDDRTQRVQLEITVRNLELNKKIEGMKLHFWAFGQSMVNRKAFNVIDAGTFDVTLDNSMNGRELKHKCEEITLQWDDTNAKFGVAYKGYLLVLSNAQNEVVAVKSDNSTWQRAFQQAFDLKKGAWCGLDLESVKAPRH